MDDTSSSQPLSDPVGRRLLVAIALVYLLTAKGYLQTTDTTYSLLTAESIVLRGRLDVPAKAGSTMKSPDGLNYSKYGVGLGLTYTPVVAFSQLLGGAIGQPTRRLEVFFLSFFNVPFGLITLILFGRLLHQFGTSAEYARLLTAGLALGTLCWRYTVYDFSEVMQAALLLLAVYGAVGLSAVRLLSGGLAFCGLVLVKVANVVFLPIFVGYLLLLWQRGIAGKSPGRSALFVVPVVVGIGLVGLLNAARFGTLLETGYGNEARQFFPSQLPSALPRLIGSLDSGLLVYCPVLVLGVAGWRPFFRRHPCEAALCAGIVIANLLLAGLWNGGWGIGWHWGPRPLVQAIPLWLLPAGLAFGGCPSARSRRWIFGLVLISTIVQVPGVLVNTMQIKNARYNVLTEPERREFPADITVAWTFLGHKLTRWDELYSVAEFGIPGERLLNLANHRTFVGFDVWTEQVARKFNVPPLRFLPLAGLVVVLVLATISHRNQIGARANREPRTAG